MINIKFLTVEELFSYRKEIDQELISRKIEIDGYYKSKELRNKAEIYWVKLYEKIDSLLSFLDHIFCGFKNDNFEQDYYANSIGKCLKCRFLFAKYNDDATMLKNIFLNLTIEEHDFPCEDTWNHSVKIIEILK